MCACVCVCVCARARACECLWQINESHGIRVQKHAQLQLQRNFLAGDGGAYWEGGKADTAYVFTQEQKHTRTHKRTSANTPKGHIATISPHDLHILSRQPLLSGHVVYVAPAIKHTTCPQGVLMLKWLILYRLHLQGCSSPNSTPRIFFIKRAIAMHLTHPPCKERCNHAMHSRDTVK